MKIASLVATGFIYYLNNRQYYQLHRQTHSLLTVSSTKMGEEKSSCVSDDCSCDHDHDDGSSSSSHSATTKVTGREIAFVDKVHELSKIMEDDIQLVVWKQQEQPSFIKVITHQCSMLRNFFLCTLKLRSLYIHSTSEGTQ